MADAQRKWWGLVAVALGVAVIVIDTTIVNVIVPSLIGDLGIDAREAQWVQESYAIVFAALLLVAGRLSDLWGARRAFLIGVLIFGVASVAAAAATSGGMLIAARLLQGAGGAFILPASLTLINANFEGRDRGKAFAVWGSTIGAGAAVGPLLGGWLDGYSWRWVFAINIALVILVVAGVMAFMRPSERTRGDVDVLGAILSVLGLGLLAFGLVEGRTYGWLETKETFSIAGADWSGGISPVFVALVLAVLLLAALVVRQIQFGRRGRRTPLIDTRLFAIRSFGLGNVATLLIRTGEFGIIAVLPLWLQFALGYSAVQAGLALMALAGGSFVASGASFTLTERLSPVGLVRIGLVLEIAGLVMLGVVAAADTSWWQIGGALFVYGVGVGFATAQVTNVVLVDVPQRSAGSASGVQSAIRQTGSALGIAILTTVFYTAFASDLERRVDRIPAAPPAISARIVDAGGAAIPQLDRREETAPIADAGRQSMSDAVSDVGFLSAGLLLIGLLATALIPGRRPDDRDDAPPPERRNPDRPAG